MLQIYAECNLMVSNVEIGGERMRFQISDRLPRAINLRLGEN